MSSNEEDYEIIYELYKQSAIVLLEKNTWSIDQISVHLSNGSNLREKTEIVASRLKCISKEIRRKTSSNFF